MITAILLINVPIVLSATLEEKNSEYLLSSEAIKFSHLSTIDGLSSSNVFGITQDKQGFLWFATEDGINRYDGSNFVTYRHTATNPFSVADNVIRKIFIDQNNTLWVGTENGLSRYNRELDNFDNFINIPSDETSLQDNIIWDIYQDNNNLLWVSTATGIHTFPINKRGSNKGSDSTPSNHVNFKRIHLRGHEDKLNEIKTIFQDANNNYWLGSYENGIHILNNNKNNNLSYAGSLQGNNKLNLAIDAMALFDIKIIDKNYWLGTDNGVFVIDDHYRFIAHFSAKATQSSAKQNNQALLSNQIRAIEQLDSNHVWLATSKGLNSINLLDNNIENYQTNTQHSRTTLSENWLMDIYRDTNDNIWLASYGGGLNKYSPLSAKFKHGLVDQNKRVESFTKTSDGTIWLSTEQSGLYSLSKKNTLKYFPLNLNISVWQVLSNNNNLWLRTKNSKLFKFTPKSKTLIEHKKWFESSQHSINQATLMISDSIWYINQDGLLTSYDTKKQKFKPFSLKNKQFTTIQSDKNKNLWLVTTNNEIFTFNVANKIFTKQQLNYPAHISVKKVALSKNWLWLGTDSQGVVLINKHNNKNYIFNERNGLKNNYISAILIDEKENAWLSTNSGISKISPKTKYIQNFDNDFSIIFPEFIAFSALRYSNSQLFFGSPNGFYQFDPNEFSQIKNNIAKPLFTNLYVANKKITITNEIPLTKNSIDLINDKKTYTIAKQLNALEQVKFKYQQSPIRFEFVSPNAKLPARLRYKYRLTGLEENWIEAYINNHSATYTNLSSGDYIFEVQAYDLYNPKNNKTSQLNVHIMPPWWFSPTAILIYSLLGLLIIATIFQQLRHRRLYHLQVKQSEERLKLSLWGSGDEMWDWNIKTGKIFRSNIWEILEFPQDGTRNVGAENTNVHQHDLPRVRQALTEHFEEKTEHFEVTYRVQDKNNQWLWILDRGKIVERDDDNKPLRMTGTLKDISQIKTAEERLKLFAKCIENISDAVVIYDRQFIAVDVNKAFVRITGKPKQQMIGCSFSFTQYPSNFTQNIKKHLISNGSWHGEIESQRGNGSKYLTDLNIDVIRDENNSISHFVGVFSDITKRKETEAELRKLASSDTLTGLPNRSFFQANQARLVKKKINHALLVFDLDNFKKINDSMGHQIGDAILCQVAQRMLNLGRKKDTVYRLGGDEFSIIIEDTNDIHTIASLAKKVLHTIALPYKLRKHEVVLYSSIGIVLYPEDGATGHELLKNADTAMYHAKDSGGNKYQFFSDSMNKQAVKRLQIENLIRHGLKDDLFSVYYQPKIEISTGKISGMEALVRFETPSKGIISPVVFIPVSEDTGQIIDIGEIVLRKACFATKKWVDAGLFEGRVAVNLSAVQFTQANLVALIASILAESGLPAKYLELEITEGTVMDSPQDAIDTMLQIRAMGVHLSLDDFGTGYSSLAYLKKFPLNTLKIDKAFIDDIETSEQGRNMVATIVTIAHNLGMQVVAEGVETNLQLSFLSGLRCEQLQGYLYSKPLATNKFQQYLLAHQITNKSTSFSQ
ncbi:MAG: EAL domain-containing protein [Colwellia sp.]